jgi:hypothetical protein
MCKEFKERIISNQCIRKGSFGVWLSGRQSNAKIVWRLYAPCHKKYPIFLLFQRRATDSFCDREHTIQVHNPAKNYFRKNLKSKTRRHWLATLPNEELFICALQWSVLSYILSSSQRKIRRKCTYLLLIFISYTRYVSLRENVVYNNFPDMGVRCIAVCKYCDKDYSNTRRVRYIAAG